MILWIGLLIAGIVLFALGWRGWRVGQAPHCRKCGYDLSGIDAPATCPECGLDLTAAKAVRVGRLRRKPVLASVGGVMVLVALVFAGYQLFLTTSNLPPSKRPMWLLTLDTKNSLDSRADEAMTEIHGRWQAGKVSDETFASFIDAALDRHGDPEYGWGWQNPWSAVLFDARTNGLMRDQQFDRLRSQYFTGMELKFFLDRYRMYEESYPWWFGYEMDMDMRLSFDDQFVIIRAWPTRVTLDGEVVEQVIGEAITTSLPVGLPDVYCADFTSETGWPVHGMVGKDYRWHWGKALAHEARPQLTIPNPGRGMHHFEAEYVIEYFVEDANDSEDCWEIVDGMLPKSQPIRRETVIETFDVHIIANASEVIVPVGPEQGYPEPIINTTRVRNGQEQTLSLLVLSGDRYGGDYARGRYLLSGTLIRHERPGDRVFGCFDIFLLIDGERAPLIAMHDGGQLTLRIPPSATSAVSARGIEWHAAVALEDLPRLDSVDLLLIPNLAYAAGDPSAHEVWNQQIILRDVPLRWSAFDDDEETDTP